MEEFDPVNKPKHYTEGKYECIEVMEEEFGKEAVQNFCLLNAFKYLYRCNKKHKTPVEDIEKAKWYLEKWISLNVDTAEDSVGSFQEKNEQCETPHGMCICVKSSNNFVVGNVYYYDNGVMYDNRCNGYFMVQDWKRYEHDRVCIPANGEFIPLMYFDNQVKYIKEYRNLRKSCGIADMEVTYRKDIDKYEVSYEIKDGCKDQFVYQFSMGDKQ